MNRTRLVWIVLGGIVLVAAKGVFLALQFPAFMPDTEVRRVLYAIPVFPHQLSKRTQLLLVDRPGIYSMYAKLLYPPLLVQPYDIWADAQFPGASIAKLYIVAAAFDAIEQGTLSLSQTVSISEGAQKAGNYGTGILRFRVGFTSPYSKKTIPPKELYSERLNGPIQARLGDLLYLSIRYSDNLAILGVAQTVGRDNVQRYVEELGLTKTSILTYDTEGTVVRPNLTSARDIGVFLEKLYRRNSIPAHAQTLLSWLGETEESDRIVYPLPPFVRVYHKTAESSEEGVYHDAGIVVTPHGTVVILVVLSQQPVGTAGEFAATQMSVIRAVSRLVYNHVSFNEQLFFFPVLPGVRELFARLNL